MGEEPESLQVEGPAIWGEITAIGRSWTIGNDNFIPALNRFLTQHTFGREESSGSFKTLGFLPTSGSSSHRFPVSIPSTSRRDCSRVNTCKPNHSDCTLTPLHVPCSSLRIFLHEASVYVGQWRGRCGGKRCIEQRGGAGEKWRALRWREGRVRYRGDKKRWKKGGGRCGEVREYGPWRGLLL